MGKLITYKWTEMTTEMKKGVIGSHADGHNLSDNDLRTLVRIYEQIKPDINFTRDLKSYSINEHFSNEINLLTTKYLSK
ncbi:hypothetical protein ACTJKN_05320 [Pedobacter sp. 22163]|uniref:hypothetical protein n=1 Tax=Pedobacter sp. 22163 TaxID=3453883 RepID=UPI003F84F165